MGKESDAALQYLRDMVNASREAEAAAKAAQKAAEEAAKKQGGKR